MGNSCQIRSRVTSTASATATAVLFAAAVLCSIGAANAGVGVVEEVELGIYDINSAETTPILWHGELMLVEGRLDSAKPGENRIHVGGEPLLANGSSHFRVRRQVLLGHGSNEVVVPMIPDSTQISFCNAHVQHSGPGGALGNSSQTLWVFGTNDDTRWGAPARSQVHAFWSSDPALKDWNHSIAITLPDGYVAFNTDVTAGPGGYSFMAIELNAPAAIVGVPFTTVFAKTPSLDLSTGWTLLDPTTHVYFKARYSACPTIRYFEEDQYFYMTTLFGGVPNGSKPWPDPPAVSSAGGQFSSQPLTTSDSSGGYPCCFVTVLVRSRDLISWQGTSQNPLHGWPDWSDRVIYPGSLLDTLGTAHQQWIGTALNYSDINRSDQDMVELPPDFIAQLPGERVGAGPWTYSIYAAGDQLR
jgi:hypothetical protein